MGRIAWSQLRFRAARSIALLAGMMLAVTAFTVLTAASRTSQLTTIGTISAHFQPAYDILVRPKASRTRLESQTGTVQPNFLSGIYGGITLAQYHQIQQVPGVAVAAPIAMVGYTLPTGTTITVPLPAKAAARPGRQLYRFTTTWVSAGGTTRVRQPASFVYVTPDRISFDNSRGQQNEVLPGGRLAKVCSGYPGHATNPFGPAAQSESWCWSKVDGLGYGPGDDSYQDLTARRPGFTVRWAFPMLIAAIDPIAEAKLDGLDQALSAGKYLSENAGPGVVSSGGTQTPTFPVLAAASSGIGEHSVTVLQRLPSPAGPATLDPAAIRAQSAAPGQTVLTTTITAQQAYQRLLFALSHKSGGYPAAFAYWNVGPTRYHRNGDGSLTPVSVANPASVWQSPEENSGLVPAPMDNSDRQYRELTEHKIAATVFNGNLIPIPLPRLVGVFNQGKIRSFDPLSRVPLGGYEPTAAAPANAASSKALGGTDLQPALNLGGYVSQPVQLITTLSALPALENSYFDGGTHATDPISVVRVRVAGVSGPDPVSLERIKETAQQIAVRTGLDVDIVSGSSPAPTVIELPAGKYGQPALRLTEGWVKKGVAVAILTSVDKKSVVLFGLILIVCALFVANSATAAVRGRRQELGILACLGWTRPRLFAAVLGELAVIGLAAGIGGGLASLPLAAGLQLHASPARALLAVPAAVVLAVAAGAVPAWLASRAEPAASVRPAVRTVRRGHQTSGITGLAAVNVLRTPGRSLIGALSLAVGVAALTLITAVTLAFRGTVVGSLLGNAIAFQIRGVDFVAVAASVVLGVLAVADVLFLNIRERSAEIATMRALGWRESALSRLIVTEGVIIGVARLGGRRGRRAAGRRAIRRPVPGPPLPRRCRGGRGRRAGHRRGRGAARAAAPPPSHRAATS